MPEMNRQRVVSVYSQTGRQECSVYTIKQGTDRSIQSVLPARQTRVFSIYSETDIDNCVQCVVTDIQVFSI